MEPRESYHVSGEQRGKVNNMDLGAFVSYGHEIETFWEFKKNHLLQILNNGRILKLINEGHTLQNENNFHRKSLR